MSAVSSEVKTVSSSPNSVTSADEQLQRYTGEMRTLRRTHLQAAGKWPRALEVSFSTNPLHHDFDGLQRVTQTIAFFWNPRSPDSIASKVNSALARRRFDKDAEEVADEAMLLTLLRRIRGAVSAMAEFIGCTLSCAAAVFMGKAGLRDAGTLDAPWCSLARSACFEERPLSSLPSTADDPTLGAREPERS